MKKFKYKIAEKKHDEALRKLLHKNPMIGAISLAFENEPNYFLSSQVGNISSETIICEDEREARVISMLNRSVKRVFLNGKEIVKIEKSKE